MLKSFDPPKSKSRTRRKPGFELTLVLTKMPRLDTGIEFQKKTLIVYT